MIMLCSKCKTETTMTEDGYAADHLTPEGERCHLVVITCEAARYPFRARCSCTWRTDWGYMASHAAQLLADEHVAACQTLTVVA